MLSDVQKAVYDWHNQMQDSFTLINIQKNTKNINNNYIMMSQPYIGIFTDGAEK